MVMRPYLPPISTRNKVRLYKLMGNLFFVGKRNIDSLIMIFLLFLPSIYALYSSSVSHAVEDKVWIVQSIDANTPKINESEYSLNYLLYAIIKNQADSKDFMLPNQTGFKTDKVHSILSLTAFENFAKDYGITGHWVNYDQFIASFDSNEKGCQRLSYLYGVGLLAVNASPMRFVMPIEGGSKYVYILDPLLGLVIYPCKYFLDLWSKADSKNIIKPAFIVDGVVNK